MKYCIIIASLRVEDTTQYTNHQMNNAVKTQIYLKNSQYISLDWLFHMTVRNDFLTVTKTHIATILQIDMQNN